MKNFIFNNENYITSLSCIGTARIKLINEV